MAIVVRAPLPDVSGQIQGSLLGAALGEQTDRGGAFEVVRAVRANVSGDISLAPVESAFPRILPPVRMARRSLPFLVRGLADDSLIVSLSTEIALMAADFALAHKLAFTDAVIYAGAPSSPQRRTRTGCSTCASTACGAGGLSDGLRLNGSRNEA